MMRWKIILVNGGIAIVVAIITFIVLDSSLTSAVANPVERKAAVERAIRAANDRLELDALRLERWLDTQAETATVEAVFSAGTSLARSAAATKQASRILAAAAAEPGIQKLTPQLILFVDSKGISVGRNGSDLMRGEDIGSEYPELMKVLKDGHSQSDIWASRRRQEQMLVTYAPVRSAQGAVLGAVVLGTPLNDERLTLTSAETSDGVLIVGVPTEDDVDLIAASGRAAPELMALAAAPNIDHAAVQTLGSHQAVVVADKEVFFGTAPLRGYGTAQPAVLIAAVPRSPIGSVGDLLLPIFAVALGGLLLIIIAGVVLDNYIARPIAELEEGLLAIINGQEDLRFDIEHPELGGLVHGINSLLNIMTDVVETDDDGRASIPHSADTFQET